MVRLYGRDWTRDELMRHIGRIEQIGGIQPVVGDDGPERGARILRVRTGSGLQFDVLPDRALDISSASYKGLPLAWSSPAGDVHPAYYESVDRGWLRTFPGGLFVTAGLDQFGAATEDAGERLGLHGRVGHIPARSVTYSGQWEEQTSAGRWEGDEYRLALGGEVRQYRLFGENLVLRRTISTYIGSSTILLYDIVTNEGHEPWPHMILYHFNLGHPLISPDSTLHIDAPEPEPRDDDARAGLYNWRNFEPPTTGWREQVFRHSPTPDGQGYARATVSNPALGLNVRLTLRPEQLPHLFQWKMMGQGAYVLGLEPANSSGIEGRATARERDDLPHLAPGESRQYLIEISVWET